MRLALGMVLMVAALWAGWWVGASHLAEQAMTRWLEDRRAEGWAVDYAPPETAGFPLRFETTLRAVALADPDTGLAWEAPDIVMRAEAYRPTRLTVSLPREQLLASPFERLTLTSGQFDAVLGVAPLARLRVEESAVTLSFARVQSTLGWRARVREAAIQTRIGADPLTQDIRLQARDVTLPAAVVTALDPRLLLQETIAELRLEAEVRFDAPWDIDALEVRRPQPRQIALRDARLIWGGVDIALAGDLMVDAEGVPEGTLSVRIVNWRDLLSVLEDNGTLPAQLSGLVMRGMEALAGASGRPDTVDAELTLRAGVVRMGLIPLGPAPRLVIR